MKKILLTFSFLISLLLVQSVKAMTFDEAFAQNDRKPMVILIYAQWADGAQNCMMQYRMAQSELSDKFNFVELDIAKPEAKSFNNRYHIYPKLPYILMFRDNGKVSRYIQRDCASSASCIVSKLKTFIQ
ncbi:hypothetical protein IJ384_01245 [bacterium]|nr:hypothetical protein [bacterium]